jgi:hypothetical protein
LGWNYPFLFYALSLPFAFVVLTSLPETRVQRSNDDHKGIINGFKALKELKVIYTIFQGFALFSYSMQCLSTCHLYLRMYLVILQKKQDLCWLYKG